VVTRQRRDAPGSLTLHVAALRSVAHSSAVLDVL